MSYVNKRQHCRLVVDIEGFAVVPESGTAFRCCVRDISLGGAYLLVPRGDDCAVLRLGQGLELHFWGIGRLSAQIVHKGPDGVGVRFRNDHRSQVEFADRLGEFMRRQLRAWSENSLAGAAPGDDPPAEAQNGSAHPNQQSADGTIQAMAHDDRRTSRRRRVIRRGKVIFRNHTCIMDCMILDISEGGARIRPVDTAYLPEDFTLRIHDGEVRHCELVWRSKDVLGVRFLTPAHAPSARPRHALDRRE